MEEDESEKWTEIPNCRNNEIFINKKCVKFSQLESEIKKLVRKKKRSLEEEERLATIHQAMKDYLDVMEEMKKQVAQSQSYVTTLLSYVLYPF